MQALSSPEKIILLIERDNWQQDNALNNVLLLHLQKNGHKVVWEDPAGHILYKVRRMESRFKWVPGFILQMNLRIVQMLYGLTHWSYFRYLSDRSGQEIEARCAGLKKVILKLGAEKDIIVLSRSAGGRISSRIADEVGVKHLICLGYPFKHPNEDPEPTRYEHLSTLKTPMLIIQGERDEYGGIDVKEKYSMSPAVELFFVDTNHDFNLTESQWKIVLDKIDTVLDA